MARILIEAHHPAHIHFWKYPIRELRARGHEVLLIGRDRDVMRRLLEVYDWIPHVLPTRAGNGKRNQFPALEMVRRQGALWKYLRQFRADLVLSLMGSYAQTAKILGIPNWIFTDSEFQHFNHRISHPFADRIYTPKCFYKALGDKQITYEGYHELAFLHKNHFTPNDHVLSFLDSRLPREYVIFRTSAWDTLHDWKHSGLGEHLFSLIKAVQETHRVWIVAEGGQLPAELEALRFRAPAELFHEALAFARLVVTEGASTASEATCLGVPAFYVNNTEPRGYLLDQFQRYGWPKCSANGDGVEEAVRESLKQDQPESAYEVLRDRVSADHIDVCKFILEEIEAAYGK